MLQPNSFSHKFSILLIMTVLILNLNTGWCQTSTNGRVLTGAAVLAGTLLGDDWSRLKAEELGSLEVYDYYNWEYEQLSWWNPYSKFKAWSKQKSAKKIYLNRFEKRRDLEVEMAKGSNSSTIKDLTDIAGQISGTILDIGELFGSKKATTKKGLIKASRELEDARYAHETAGFLGKFKTLGPMKEKQKAFENAENAYTAAWGKTPGTGADLFLSREKQVALVDIIEENTEEKSKRLARNRFKKFVGIDVDPAEQRDKDIEQAKNMAGDIINALKGKKAENSSDSSGIEAVRVQLNAANAKYTELLSTGRSSEAAQYHASVIRPLMDKMEKALSQMK
ncbi:MAG: hypothetical protein CVV64_13360 [Candidatus Wallbacteria bacterium HGW-Wallbacteria-1]|uniref:Uncharacterized protein n=1 Tax=Candidatus Wallbacteria bacterium HGW-Wallbacteria-1 TaxID=2013854 RepID=A0A2N1PMW4_9BACT|nr:MAG: hypothetical protein CVV64_13360 [Candidatus Wallbacteria bacterium HGW-Wallbacteria-1]